MTAHDLHMHAITYDNAAVAWYRMADDAQKKGDEFGRRYCAQIAAQLADSGRAFRHRAMMAAQPAKEA